MTAVFVPGHANLQQYAKGVYVQELVGVLLYPTVVFAPERVAELKYLMAVFVREHANLPKLTMGVYANQVLQMSVTRSPDRILLDIPVQVVVAGTIAVMHQNVIRSVVLH